MLGLLLGAYFLWGPIEIFTSLSRASDWKRTEGVVTLSQRRYAGDANRGRTTCYFAYRYEVDGKEYMSSRYMMGRDSCAGVSSVDKGERVHVFYDPDQPSTAVIDKSISFLALFVHLPLGILLSVGGVWFSIHLLRRPAPLPA